MTNMLIFISLLTLLGLAIWKAIEFECEHPCVRLGAKATCWSTYPQQIGDVTIYQNYEYDCTPCLERK